MTSAASRPDAPREDGARSWRIGIDVGGTFTDAVALASDGTAALAKVASDPRRPAEAFAEALRELIARGVDPAQTTLLVYGTTIATNALLQRDVARVILVATEGFRDVVAIGTGTRQDMYDLWASAPEPLVARRDRIEARERIDARGEAVESLTPEEAQRVAAAVSGRRPESVAVALLFSYANPEHERRLAEALSRAVPGVPVTLSSDVAREFREYPRTHTTAVAAALRPASSRHLEAAVAATEAAGIHAPFLVMLSSGGTATASRAASVPHQLVLSGPAGGAAHAIAVGARLGFRDLISLDMGGTSADVCLIQDGVPPTAPVQTLAGAPILAPAVDIVTAGAGGGSIARGEQGVSLRVGPRSAGAAPGPAAYGRGGTEPTVTDAHLVVGTLSASTRLAGRLALDPSLAERAIARVAAPLGLSVEDAAAGILSIAAAHLARAVRRVSLERGRDPRGLPLVALGGAGPLHASLLLRELGLGEIIVPPRPGLGSASGLLAADLRTDASQTVLVRLDSTPPARLLGWFRLAHRELSRRLAADGLEQSARRFAGSIDCRYVGQGYELAVPVPNLDLASVRGVAAAFHDLHRRTYGHAAAEEPVEAVTLRLSAFGALPRAAAPEIERGARGGAPAVAARLPERPVRLPGSPRRSAVAVWHRDALRAGDRLRGPCIVEQLDATTLVLSGMEARVGRYGDLRIHEAA